MNPKDTYQLVTLENGTQDAASILNVFAEMASGGRKPDLTLLNYYHEVPVSYPATVVGIEADSVELAVHEHQAMVIKSDNSTLVKSAHFPNGLGVHCYAAYANVTKKTVILHNFAYAQIRAERRDAVRVRLDQPVPVCLSSRESKSVGTIVDISGCGISVQCAEPPAVTPEGEVQLSFGVLGTMLSVSAAFVRTIANGEEGPICSFQLRPDSRAENLIGRFIYQRQIEIIQDLKSRVAA
ncbi:PilZ domain-containing protein [Geomesophilobacter sediminis]|uniref:PilZ domain-containing protein n=1 Tax=Geomesophilobacter sediminis TaxID=2798584 RepID=A0A8J7IN72_9BACT|nr:PilZ domain-containing protein [Geomesophilobacter sediminis]MBJ6724548.1 PilZ domain-containing protein [Geomesophilobacter sediminis]